MTEQPGPRQSRREFCAGACHAASGVALTTLVSACSGGGGGSPTAPSPGSFSSLAVVNGNLVGGAVQVSTATGALATVGGAARVQSGAGSFLVTRTGQDSFTVVTAICTHEACTITGSTVPSTCAPATAPGTTTGDRC